LEVIRRQGGFRVVSLTANTNARLMFEQIREFAPDLAVMTDADAAHELSRMIKSSGIGTEILSGEAALLTAAAVPGADTVLNALVGSVGLRPTLAAIAAGKRVALANKETLVAGGELVMAAAEASGAAILPVDSEHSAIFQCLQEGGRGWAEKILLTASGGPFRLTPAERFADITPAMALCHPNWSMGAKITIDSATLMNKGLEVIEAHWLFGRDLPVEILVHPESVVHSMVQFRDGAVLAQLGVPDMRAPIAYALYYPERVQSDFPRADFPALGRLTFESPDYGRFPCLRLALSAYDMGGAYPAVMSAANETAVERFLKGSAGFTDIPVIIEKTLSAYNDTDDLTADAVDEAGTWARAYAREVNNVNSYSCAALRRDNTDP
jgi:1-deoxy-D-xylulose-5-phosphate reductoisomerase